MFVYSKKNATIKVNFEKGFVESFALNGRELLTETHAPLFVVRLMDKDGRFSVVSAFDATKAQENGNECVYSGFSEDVDVKIKCNTDTEYFVEWSVEVTNRTDKAIEWVDLADYNFKNFFTGPDGEGRFVMPYNEGALFDSLEKKEKGWFYYRDPEYPSEGSYTMFPYMQCAQFEALMIGNDGIYIGAHDTDRCPKCIDIRPLYDGATTQFRLFCGTEFGEDYVQDYPLVTDIFEGDWTDACEIYRKWFDCHLPEGLKPIGENDGLPEWYDKKVLTVMFPVRGRHDTDPSSCGGIFPYMNAMPYLDEIKQKTNSRIMALLLHWEGTATWAPPYVWPPYGGEEPFNEFADAIHKNGDLLGVYCSGLGYTIYSRIDPKYNRIDEFRFKDYDKAMCVAPDQTLPLSKICTAQRAGYDICPSCDLGKEILNSAYEPLLEAKIDYAQIMDQNHGGSQYFCYSKDHGHPPVPGKWMTKTMQDLLTHWNNCGTKPLIGCESAAAEPYLGNLRYSDNRFELNFLSSQPVPLYSYLYHRYLHNFMGNQCCCFLMPGSIYYRLAYAFSCGDDLSIIIRGDGNVVSHWGRLGHEEVEDKDTTLNFVANLIKFYKEKAAKWMYNGRMIKPLRFEVTNGTKEVTFDQRYGGTYTAQSVLSTAWESSDGQKVQVFINHTKEEITLTLSDGRNVTVSPFDAAMVEI